MRDPQKTIGNLIDKAGHAFISYIDNDGFPVTKAMLAPRERTGIGTFYFSTNTSSNKVRFFRENPKCSLYFMNKRFYQGVSLLGTVELLEDEESKKRIWRAGDSLYYPQGVTDPDYCVLRITVTKGRYYSSFKSEDFDVPT